MATSTPGIGSGLDVTGIVNQMVAVERQPLQKLQQRATAIQAQISSWGKLQGLIDSLRTASSRLATASTWTQTQVTSSDPNTVSATLSANGSPSPGRHSITVSQLAQQHVLSSAAIAQGTDLRGRLRIELGTYGSESPPTFTARSGSPVIDLQFTDSSTTLSTVRDAINAANGGVTASILTDSSGSRLVISSAETGRDRAIKITVSGIDPVSGGSTSGTGSSSGSDGGLGGLLGGITSGIGGALSSATGGLTGSTGTTITPTGLNALAYDGSTNSSMIQNRAAQDANFTVNGVALSSSTNTLDGTITGVRMVLAKVSSTPVDITIQADAGSQRKTLEEFVSAYNAVNAQLSADTSYDANSRKGGIFQGDFTALSVKRRLRETISQSSSASSVYSRFSDLGLDIRRDGNIVIDAAKLDRAMVNPGEVAKLMSSIGSGSEESKGLSVRLKGLIDGLLSRDGDLDAKNDALQDRLKRNRTDQDRLAARIEATRQRLLRLYQSLDTRVTQLNGLGNYVTQQFGNRD